MDLIALALILAFNINMAIGDFKERKVRHFMRAYGVAIAMFLMFHGMELEFGIFVLSAIAALLIFNAGGFASGDTIYFANALWIWYAPIVMLGVMVSVYALHHVKVLDKERYKGTPLAGVSSLVLVVSWILSNILLAS